MDLQAQTIIEFSAGGDHRFGVITGELGKKKLIVISEQGDEMRPSRDEVTFEVGPFSSADPERIVEKLGRLRAEVDALAADVDVAMLWEFAGEEEKVWQAPELAELMFASTEAAETLAIIQTLRKDPIYFKTRKDGAYEPRSSAQVEALTEQNNAERKKEEERQAFFGAFKSILEASMEERFARLQDAMQETAFRGHIDLLRDYAAIGDEFVRARQADDLLTELATGLERRLKGKDHLRAFYLLVDLGYWEEHENLWLHRFRISTEAPQEIVMAANKRAETPWEPESWRRDLTDVFCITIDDESTRDIDDALSIKACLDGGWEVGVHIADPSARVPSDSPLDLDARSRSTSLYLPTGVIPMFPRALSESAMSLIEAELRPAITTRVRFSESLQILETEVFPSLVRVDKRLSYDEADALLESSEENPLTDAVHYLKYIADECMTNRESNGAFSVDLPEVKLKVDLSNGAPVVSIATVDNESPSRMLVSELMILGNQVMAEFCAEREIPTIYRTQEAPEGELLDADILAMPEGIVRSFAMVRKMKRGDITTRPGPHFGLGLQKYVQASSPIRRYGDLVCQRQIKAFLADEPLPFDGDTILNVLATVDNTTREAIRAERETVRYWVVYHLAQQKGEPLDATVLEHKDDQGTRVSVFLKDSAYRANCTLRQKVPLGETVQVMVERADPRKDILVLREA
ncbi:MAG: RNB domain-containing ribonuclease [Bradymonadaceae bacterium]